MGRRRNVCSGYSAQGTATAASAVQAKGEPAGVVTSNLAAHSLQGSAEMHHQQRAAVADKLASVPAMLPEAPSANFANARRSREPAKSKRKHRRRQQHRHKLRGFVSATAPTRETARLYQHVCIA
jgi:hypothetical protein